MFETILLIIFTICFLVIAWWKLDWAVVLTVVFSPAYVLRFQLGFIPMTVLEIMVLSVIAVWALRMLRLGRQTKSCPLVLPWTWRLFLLLWVMVGTAAVVSSPDIRQALGLWKAYIVEPALFFVVIITVIRTPAQVRSLLWGLGGSVAIVGYVALAQYAGLFPIAGLYGSEMPPRATSVFPFPTAVGKYIGPIVGLFLGFVLGAARRPVTGLWQRLRRDFFPWGVILFGLFGLLFSYSRGALLGVGAALVTIGLFSPWRKRILVSLAILALFVMVIPPTRQEVVSVLTLSDTSADVHAVMWKGAARIIQANPISGTGLASFPEVYEQYKEASHVEYFPNPDHLWLTLWIELGLAGVVVFIWLLVKYFAAARDLLRMNRALAVGLIAAMVVILVHGLVDTPYFKNDLAIIFWTLVGLAVVRPSVPSIVKPE